MRDIINKTDFTKKRPEFWRDMLDRLLSTTEGDIIEIGAGHGESTRILCQMAQKYNRVVFVIDPFESGWEDMPKSYQYGITQFKELCKEFDNIIHHQLSSQDPVLKERVKYFGKIAFAFVDGLQTKEAVRSDIDLMEQVGASIICVDDADRLSGDSRVPEALQEYSGDYEIFVHGREAYLCL